MQLSRLVRTKAIWIDWRLERDSCDDFVRLLRGLVVDVADPGERWLGVYGDAGGADERRHLEWVTGGDQARTHVTRVYERLLNCLTRYPGDVLDHLNQAECQVLLGPSAIAALVGEDQTPHTTSMCALVDLDFQRSRRLKTVDYRCNIRLSMWSGWPNGRTLPDPPAAAQHPGFDGITDQALVRFRDGTDAVLAGFSGLLGSCFDEQELHIFGRRYLPPQFFIAVPAGDISLPGLLSGNGSDPSLLTMARRFLDAGHVDDTTVAISVVKGELIALRRFVPSQRSRTDEPSYVIVQTWPGGLKLAEQSPMLIWRRAHGATEGSDKTPDDEHVHPAVRSFTELERQVADNLLRLTADTRLYQHHVDVYSAIARRVGQLWDGLALHMPTSKGATLERVHSALQVLHEILLQGVADLAEIVSSIGRTRAEYERVRETLMQRYQRAISERPGRRNPTIGMSMVDTGHFRRLATSIESARARAQRVQDGYAGLLDAINKAFDERRARESDVLERSSFQLGRALGLLAIVTIADFLAMQAELPLSPLAQQALRVTGVAMAAYVVLSVARSYRRARVAGRIMRPRFARTFRDLQLFLRSVSTPRLTTFGRDVENTAVGARAGRTPLDRLRRTAASSAQQQWRRKDAELATAFAELWDRAVTTSDRPRWQALRTAVRSGRARRLEADLIEIEDDIRAWTVRALLASERPRELHHFPLLELACMYRLVHHCRDGLSFGDLSLLSPAEWSQITRSFGILDYERELDWWAQQHSPWPSAEALLRDVRSRLLLLGRVPGPVAR